VAYPSTFKDLQDNVIAKVRLDATADRPKVKDWINRYYSRICVENEVTQTSATMTVTPGVASYTLPAAILRIKDIVGAPPGGGYGPPLEAVSLDQILAWRQTGTVAPISNQTSTRYALAGQNELELFPTPANADTLLIYYVYLPTPLSADADVPVLQEPYATECLEYGACFEAAAFKGDPAAGDWHSLYADAASRLTRHLSRRVTGNTGQLRVVGTRTPLYLRADVDTGI
jgi:hypothetical protein